MILDLMGAAQQMVSNVAKFILELGFLAFLFGIMLGAIFHFTHYHKGGKTLLVNGIIGMIICTVLYMWLFNTSGPPDISIFFMDLSGG